MILLKPKTVIENVVRENIKTLKPYSSARDEFKGKNGVFLDANENPFGQLNRYPDPYQSELKRKLAELKNLPTSHVFVGNGSDEIIDLSMRIFCDPGKDEIMICPPTYGMYQVSAEINNVGVIKVPLKADFQLDTDRMLQKLENTSVKIVFLCSPNNPTGNSLDDIEKILLHFNGIVFVDEAYIDFSERDSLVDKIKQHPNLIVSQTFSKARALAGARVGIGFAGEKMMTYFNRIKPPYNVSVLNQEAAVKALENEQEFEERKALILTERKKLIEQLKELDFIKRIYPTDANFILIQLDKATQVYNSLAQNKVVIRDRSALISDTLRITVGKPDENEIFIKALKKL